MIESVRIPRSICLVVGLAFLPLPASAQNFSSPGQSWSGGWGFGSVSQRSVMISQAQAIRAASSPAGPSTIVYNTTTNDYRSNYQEIGGSTGAGSLSLQVADVIGQNTNSVGAMNTGTTTIDLVGDNNIITATNAADSNGCIDGSVSNLSSTLTDLGSGAGLLSANAPGMLSPSVALSSAGVPCRP